MEENPEYNQMCAAEMSYFRRKLIVNKWEGESNEVTKFYKEISEYEEIVGVG